MRLPQRRTGNLLAAVALPVVSFIVIAFIVGLAGEWRPDVTSAVAARIDVAFDRLGVAAFAAVLAIGLAFLWRALGRWALLAAVVYVPAMFITVLYVGLFIAGVFFGRTS